MTPPADTGLPIEIKIYTGDNAAGGTEVGGAAPGAPSPGSSFPETGETGAEVRDTVERGVHR